MTKLKNVEKHMALFTIPTYCRDAGGQQAAWAEVTRLGHMSKLNIDNSPDGARRSSIICTIGPKTGSIETITSLRAAGMNIMRLNFSHGSRESHENYIDNLRKSCNLHPGPPIAIALDTRGPEIRTGLLENGDVMLNMGDKITLHTDIAWYARGNKTDIYCNFKDLPKVVYPGSFIFVDNGLLLCKVLTTTPDSVTCELSNSGILGNQKSCNFPGIDINLPTITENDISDFKWAAEQDVDMIFVSFVRTAADIAKAREYLGPKANIIKIVAKIENPEGIKNFPEILRVVDGVMVARGRMGIEVPMEKVFLAQKMIISMCNVAGVPVICATQMLESMTCNPRPTRAEVSDVANAIIDGADCVMLSGETAKGNYPVETVEMMAKICREAEAVFTSKVTFAELKYLTPRTCITETMAIAAVESAYKQNASAIVVTSVSGKTAGLVSKYRPRCPIIMITREATVARQAHLYRGVLPVVYSDELSPLHTFQYNLDMRINWCVEEAVKVGLILPGQTVVVLQGWRDGPGHTNTVRVLVVPAQEGGQLISITPETEADLEEMRQLTINEA